MDTLTERPHPSVAWMLAVLLSCIVAFLTYDVAATSTAGGMMTHLKDDNMITMRVAANFHATGLPYFNTGEPVAANTSLFWPILLSPGYAVFEHETYIRVLYYASCVVSVLALALAASLVRAPHRYLLLAALVLSPPFMTYGGSAWEHVPETLCVTAAFWLMLTNMSRRFARDAAAFLLAAAAFVFRPDAAIVTAGVWAFFATRHARRRLGPVALLSGATLLLPALYLSLMLHYYGDTVPNAYYLKEIGFGEIPRSLHYFTYMGLSGPILPLLAFLVVRVARRCLTGPEVWIVGISLAQVVFITLSGGDVFPNGRMFLIVTPTLSAIAVSTLLRRPSWRGHAATVLVSAALALSWWVGGLPQLRGLPAARAAEAAPATGYAALLDLTMLIDDKIDPGDGSIGLHDLGLGYHLMEFHVADFLGLAEPHISHLRNRPGPKGHNKFDYAYMLANYDIAVAPFPMARRKTLELPESRLRPGGWNFPWYFGRAMRVSGNYVFLTPDDLGTAQREFGLYVRSDLVPRFREEDEESGAPSS